MRILVTGAAGYVGSMLIEPLLQAGHNVLGYDSLVHGGKSLQDLFIHDNFEFERGDLRETEKVQRLFNDWKPEAVIHLAAIVGAPECDANVPLTEAVNYDASVQLADMAKAAGVKQFVFTSTCSNYGVADISRLATEEDEVNPVSSYADTKVRFEQYLKEQTGGDFAPVTLRLSTVYGVSRRMRFDLLINEFVRDAYVNRELEIYAGNAWRPMVHVVDVARAIVRLLELDASAVAGEIINIGNNDFNVQKMDLAKQVGEVVGETEVTIASETQDPRNYRVSFDKMEKVLGMTAERSPRQGMEEIFQALRGDIFADTYVQEYKNRGCNINILGSFAS
jgi:nucleoside-diphosphate-sugar epimerase